MNHVTAHYKPLLDQINELENSRRLQECKLVEERTKHAKTLKEMEEFNLKYQKLIANETLLKEKITHLEADLVQETKSGEQLKQSAKYCKQEEEVFQIHLARFEVETNQKMYDLKKELEDADKNYEMACEMWKNRPNVREMQMLRSQVEEYEGRLRADEGVYEEKLKRIKVLESQIKMKQDQLNDMDLLLKSIDDNISQAQNDIEKVKANSTSVDSTEISPEKAEMLIQQFITESTNLQKSLEDMQNYNQITREDIEHHQTMQETMTQLIESKICEACYQQENSMVDE